ncbi:MAG: hypothetical protein Tsb0020_32240 [Haliangiales bacterium]
MSSRFVVAQAALVAVALALSGPGCGAKPQQEIEAPEVEAGPAEPVKLPPVSPQAMAAFEDGMRWLRASRKSKRAKARRQAVDKAIAGFREAVAIDANLWEAWHNLGVILVADGDDEAAVEAFSNALAVNPTHLDSLVARAEAHRRAGRDGDARADYERALEQQSDDNASRRNATARLASLLRESRAYDDAIAVIRETLRTSGASAEVYVELALVYMAQEKRNLADLVLGKAAEIDAKVPAIYNAYALLALSRGHSQEAFEYFDQATSLDPDYLDARFNKASVLLDAGDYPRARAELEAVVAQNPEDMNARIALGVAHRGQGEYDRAQSIWETVIQEAPRRSRVRGDALFNVAVLKMNFLEDEAGAGVAFERFLQEAPRNHPSRSLAEQKKKELGL